ncbi:MAG: hypothetical protein ACKVG2_03410 [Candidatus Poseidoniales archaeon]|jgi:hypothetical protein
MAKHHKRTHNGKDRKTGRIIRMRPKKVNRPTGRRVGNPKPVMPVLPRPRPKCCETAEKKDLVNERLLAELSTLRWDKDWNEVTGTWDRVIPRHFVAKHRAHMAHFRAVAREYFGL